LANVDRSGKAGQVTTIKGYSQRVLRNLPPESFDVIYIDGSHTGYDVLADAILAWELLKEDGVIIFDDYQWRRGGGLPPELKPGPAIDAFLTMYRDFLTVIHRCYQLAAIKRNNPCSGMEFCSPIGSYTYSWKEGVLKTAKGIRLLTKRERKYIMTLLHSRGPGQTNIVAPPELVEDEDFIKFSRRLKLDFVLPVDPELQLLRDLYGPARYSQNDEELFIRDYFKNEWNGLFVDMGGDSGGGNSNTLFLERHLGWKGITMDDSETAADAAVRLRDWMQRESIDHLDFLNVEADLAVNLMSQDLDILKYKPELVCVGIHETQRNSIDRFFAERDYARTDKYSRLDPLHLYFSPH